jgi:hypothetical protein
LNIETDISPEVDAGWLAQSGNLSFRMLRTLSSTSAPEEWWSKKQD